ncbi:MAG: hypothetical protein DCE92_10175 [Alphaproteobacteria bacterium]|nr:MAG: hypothetical protein DCE92_10175 [Alphaproteobacteria bacterium]
MTLERPTLKARPLSAAIFDLDVCGRAAPRGKPDPAIFQLAAAGLRARPEVTSVIENSRAGIKAPDPGHMAAFRIPRPGDNQQVEMTILVGSRQYRLDRDGAGEDGGTRTILLNAVPWA